MPRDARLGFVVGVALVILVAVVFYRGDGAAGAAGSLGTPTAGRRGATPANGAQPTLAPALPSGGRRSHTVKEGETLQSLARRYYGDEGKSDVLFRANRSQLQTADEIPAGVVLVVPELPGGPGR